MKQVESPQGNTPPVNNRVAGFGLFMLTIVYALNFIDRQILVILQEPIKQDLGLSDTQLGLLSGFSFALVYITAGIPIAYWADRSNRRNIITAALTIWSGMTALSGLAQNFTQLLLARIGVGIGEAGGSPPAHSMISDYYPARKRGAMLAIYSSGVHIGVLAGFLLGGMISQYFGWRTAFMAVGIPGVIFAAIFYATVTEPPRGQWDDNHNADRKASLKETLNELAGCRSFWLLAFGAGMVALGGYGVGNFMPSFLIRNHGFSMSEVGMILAASAGGGGIVGTLLGGFLADRLGSTDKRWYLWLPAIAGIVALPLAIIYLLFASGVGLVVLIFLGTIAANIYLAPCIAVSHSLVPPDMRALTSSVLYFILNMIGMGLGPLAVGLLSDMYATDFGQDNLRYAMLTVSIASSSAILLFFFAARRLPVDLARSN